MATVRPATEQDIPRILELYRELVTTASEAESGRQPMPEDYERVFERIKTMPGHVLLVAEEQGEVIGTVVFLIVPNLSHSGLPWATIENMVVDSRYQRQGLGRLLMDYVIDRAREDGCYKIQLASNKNREEAHRFYQSVGFEASAHGFRRYF